MNGITLVITLALEIVLPIVLGTTAAYMTASYISDQAYTLLWLTTLSNRQLTWRLFQRVLEHWQTVLAFIAGLLPLWMALVLSPHWGGCTVTSSWTRCLSLWHQGTPINNALTVLPSMVGFPLITLVALWIGLWSALWWRRLMTAMSGALVLTLGLVLVTTATRIDDLMGGVVTDPFNIAVLPQNVMRDLGVFIVLPLLLLAAVPYLAMCTVRQPER